MFRRGSLLGVLVFLGACGSEVVGDPAANDSAAVVGDAGGDSVDQPVPNEPAPTDTASPNNETPSDPATPPTPPVDSTPPTPPADSRPVHPLSFTAGAPLELDSGTSNYFVMVPRAYDKTHNTPTKLYVYLHGCGGYSSGDVWAA